MKNFCNDAVDYCFCVAFFFLSAAGAYYDCSSGISVSAWSGLRRNYYTWHSWKIFLLSLEREALVNLMSCSGLSGRSSHSSSLESLFFFYFLRSSFFSTPKNKFMFLNKTSVLFAYCYLPSLSPSSKIRRFRSFKWIKVPSICFEFLQLGESNFLRLQLPAHCIEVSDLALCPFW